MIHSLKKGIISIEGKATIESTEEKKESSKEEDKKE